MYLKSLRIQGFKTFAKLTNLPFSHGITGIVGPNGSGKSNLVDAVRWALGERNAREIRGQRMEDLIYSGGPGKAQVGMAEVTLVIDNADGRLPVEFGEIEVTRRLYRSGESHYYINGTAARLKDIDVLLASTGLRQDGYAVVAQNDIDFVIQAVPATRRALIEEAAGVRRLRDQREEASRRLEEARRDMQRARDLLAELQPRVEELRTQAAAAEEYRALESQLRTLQGSLARDAWRKAKVQLRKAEARLASARTKCEAAAAALAEFEPAYAADRGALTAARDARFIHQQCMTELKLSLADSLHQERIAVERSEAAARALTGSQAELRRLSESTRAGTQVVEELDRAIALASADATAATTALDAALAAQDEAGEARAAVDAERSALLQRRQVSQRDRLRADFELRQLDGRIQFLAEQREQAVLERGSWLAQQSMVTTLAEREAAGLAALTRDLDSQVARVDELDHLVSEASAAVAAAEALVSAVTREIAGLEAEVTGLRLLRDRAREASPLSNGSLRLQRLLEVIEVEEPHRRAVEAVLEGCLHGWVAGTEEVAERAIALVTGSASGRETILVTSATAPVETVPSELTSARSLVRGPAALGPLLGALLHNVALVKDLHEARRVQDRYPELHLVTLSGELLTLFSYRGGVEAHAPLDVQARLTTAERNLASATARLAAARLDLDARRETESALTTERAAATVERDGARATHAQLKATATAAVADAERHAQQGLHLEQQVQRYDRLLAEVQGQQAAARSALTVAQETEALSDEALPQLEARLESQAEALSAVVRERQEAELRVALAGQRHDDLQRQRAAAAAARRAQGDELAQREAAVREQETQPAVLLEEAARRRTAAAEIQAELSALEGEPVPDAAALEALEAQVRGDEQRNVVLQVEAAHADDAEAAARVEVETCQAEVDRCAAALRDDPSSLDESEPLTEVDWQKTEREVSRLQRRLDAIGAVNLLAPEEFTQSSGRCESLTGQLQDLEAAAAQLVELRQHLEKDIDSRFRTVFQAVAANFQEFFAELFEGGRATLRLEMPEEATSPLDEGVEILAQTPGKRLQTLTLLSGGERALTALAFLFALQAVKPSPFHVLDEVDAALDDANVVRFNRVLARLARGQQFLIVTHNHSTMAQAEVLYGVTLGDHGISRIVSVRLESDRGVPALRERSA
jgi:chromosome segregation protein